MLLPSFVAWPVVLLTASALGCGDANHGGAGKVPAGYVVDHSDPQKVVEAVFLVAKGAAESRLLAELCDPRGASSLDVRRICEYASGYDPEGEFPAFFESGKIAGEVFLQGERAAVPFYFGPNGDQLDTMVLVNRSEKWYLERF